MAKRAMTKQRFINQWLRHFVPGLRRKDYENYVENQFIWHIFSFGILRPEGLLEGEEASGAFDRMEKENCICCDMFDNGGVMASLPADYDTAAKIDGALSEFYVVAGDYSWTYLKTHSGHCYFLHRKV